MFIPVACWTCGNQVAHLHDRYVLGLREGKPPQMIFQELGLEMECCQRMLLVHDPAGDTLHITNPLAGVQMNASNGSND